MTIGPDLNWLADDDGTLRAEAARVVGQATPPAAAPATPPSQPQARPHARPQPVAASSRRRAGLPATWWPVVVIGALLVGVGLGHRGAPANHAETASSTPPNAQALGIAAGASTAEVSGVNVNIRTAPSALAPALSKLRSGEVLRLGSEHAGWFAVETTSGLQGFVFGGLLHGAASSEGRPAVVTKFLRAEVDGQTVLLRPGGRVLARPIGDGTAAALLPTGIHLEIAIHDLAFLD